MSMPVIIRSAIPADRPFLEAAIGALHDELRELEPSVRPGVDMAPAYVDRLGEVFVATVDETLVGFAAMRLERAYEGQWNAVGDVAYLSDMRVDPDWRGRGVGKLLLARVEAHARSLGASQLRLMVMSGGRETRAFYERGGFSDLRTVMHKLL